MILVLGACRATNTVVDAPMEDYGLSGADQEEAVDDEEYYKDLQKAELALVARTSLPVPIRVGKAGDGFSRLPPEAERPPMSFVNLQDGPCQMRLVTGMIEIARFMWAGKWIKLNDSLAPKVPVKLDVGQDLYLSLTANLGIEISEAHLPACARKFKGRNVFMGLYNINKSGLGLIGDPKSPPVRFTGRTKPEGGKRVFLYWGKSDPRPRIIDEFDFPLMLESAIFHSKLVAPGYYYLTVRPFLQKSKGKTSARR